MVIYTKRKSYGMRVEIWLYVDVNPLGVLISRRVQIFIGMELLCIWIANSVHKLPCAYGCRKLWGIATFVRWNDNSNRSFSCKILFYIHVVLFNNYTNSYIGFVI